MSAAPPPPRRPRPGPWPPAPESTAAAGPPLTWAKRTGYRARFSGESTPATSGHIPLPQPQNPDLEPDLEAGPTQTLPPPLSAPIAASNGDADKKDALSTPPPPTSTTDFLARQRRDPDAAPIAAAAGPANGQGRTGPPAPPPPPPRPILRRDAEAGTLPEVLVDEGFRERHLHINYELRDSPGLIPIIFYSLQHYVSIIGSLVLIPLVLVPAMGGTYDDTAKVVSTVLFISGISTLLQTSFGSRLPLIQGPSFVFLAPALAIINSSEFQGLNGNSFKHIMKELQGAIIISSAFQAIMGYTGFMSLFLRLIRPVVVSPTIASIGLSFFSYGFTSLATCIEIGTLQLLLVIIFSLYLRKIQLFGHRIFLIYAVPLSLAITWAVDFLLTEAGAYNYKGCDINIPASNSVSAYCRKHLSRMKHCRADTSHALRSAPWFRFPYPLQWGTPVFNWKMALVMCAVSIIASVDSVGSYHASSVLVASRPPTAGVLSRGIGIEGISSVLAGIWGTGVGSTTLTENVHTIAVTRLGSRRAVELGAVILILLSLVGKVGGFLASIPNVIVAALLCFMWAMLAALGLSNLRYSTSGSSRNSIIIGLSLFFSLSIPAYFQQYGLIPNANSSVPSYFQPYIVASHGPFRTSFSGVNYILNTLLSLHMVIAFLIAVILDNTVPGSREERGVYEWSEPEAARRDAAISKDYGLPFRVGRAFRWVKWVGL